ncbi:MAG TPA: hypothetical protein VLM79_23175 [Kofleriaceae bacterium]|nr:hypothetical protein [Kofleriaceae bacterium]
MKVAFAFALASLAVLFARPAHADQCAWLDEPSVARRAVRELTSYPEYIELCEPCGDQAPSVPRRAGKVRLHVFEGTREVLIDDAAIDLAYVYVKTADRQYRNLAMLAGCPTTGVSPRLLVHDETPTGSLIVADPGMPPKTAAARPAPLPEPTALPVAAAPPPPAIVYVEASDPRRWLTVVALLFSLGALAAWRLGRRRLPHVPRASDLRPRD